MLLSNYSLDPGHTLYLHHSDNSNCGLTSDLLTGGNYAQWRRSCEVSLNAKNKMSFVTRDYPKHANDSPYLPLWERCNSMVISWLLHSMSKDIASSIIYTPCQLQKEMSNLSQGNLSVSTYFTKCKQLWDEYIVLVTPCACPSTGSAMKLIERQQLMQFLMGLNDSYRGVRSNILMMNPLPSVSQASSIVLQEEQQREIKPTPIPFDTESTAFLSQHRPQSFRSKNMAPNHSQPQHSQLHHATRGQSYTHTGLPRKSIPQQQGSVQCNYYKKLGHTIDKCYKLQRQRS